VSSVTTGDDARLRGILVDAARRLASAGPSAVDPVLTQVRRELRLDKLDLRRCGPAPAPRSTIEQPCVLDVPVRSSEEVLGLLTAASSSPFNAGQAGVLCALADLLALTLTDRGLPISNPAQAVLDAEADLAAAAADLDGVVEAVIALGHVGSDGLSDGLAATLGQLRAVQRTMRSVALEAGLRAALGRLDADVHADDPELDRLSPPVAAVLQRVAEAVTRGTDGRVRITATTTGTTVKLWAQSADKDYDAFELSRWARRVSALGGELRRSPEGVEVSVPARSAKDESDDSPDL
jgi:hypothetical protein